jgi:hypothetical protein
MSLIFHLSNHMGVEHIVYEYATAGFYLHTRIAEGEQNPIPALRSVVAPDIPAGPYTGITLLDIVIATDDIASGRHLKVAAAQHMHLTLMYLGIEIRDYGKPSSINHFQITHLPAAGGDTG